MEFEYDSRKNCASPMKRTHNFFSAAHSAMPLPTVTCNLSPVPWTHTFSAKERDTETGLSYFGSRYYSSDLSIWLSVDPMAAKYPSLSPFTYCANNPVKLVDPNGETIVIVGEDGTSITYSPNMNYKGQDVSVNNKIDILNKMNGTRSGKKVLNELCISQNTYSIVDHTSDGLAEAHFCANDDVQGMSGGTIVTNGNNNLYTISHELFHGYQDEKGQGGNSIYNEVEAMMFEYSVMLQSGEGSTPPIKNDNEAYNSSVNNLISNYSYDNMNKVVDGFKLFSRCKETYMSYPKQRSNQTKSLIKDFYPLF